MEKLSGIIPNNARVKSVDLEDAHPVRPGTPTYGRPVGASATKDRAVFSAESKAKSAEGLAVGRDPKDARQAAMVTAINQKFFETRLAPISARAAEAETVALPETEDLEPVEKSSPTKISIADLGLPSADAAESQVDLA